MKEITPTTNQNLSVEVLLTQAVKSGVPVETLERLLAMRRELKAEQAKEAYDLAMAKFQGECPTIKKNKAGGTTRSGVVAYYYAPLEAIVGQTKKLIQENGFSYAIQTETKKDGVVATCTAKHIAGHSEKSAMEVPLGTKTDIMSAPQVVAAALTFAKRYAFCNAFGILTGDDDIDAKNAKKLLPRELTVEEVIDVAEKMLKSCKNPDQIIKIDARVQANKMLNKEQKIKLHELASSYVDKLNPNS